MEKDRREVLHRARQHVALTLPYLLAPEGHTEGGNLPEKHQGFTSMLVQNLAAKLMVALFPPKRPPAKFQVDDLTLDRAATDPELRAEIEAGLRAASQAMLDELDQSGDRTKLYLAVIHLIVAGNVLLYEDNGIRVYPLHSYVVSRDPMGRYTEIIVEEQFTIESLPEELKSMVEAGGEGIAPDGEKEYKLYTHCMRDGDRWGIRQEFQGQPVGEEQVFTTETFPFIPLSMIDVAGPHEDYGRSYVEQFFPDIKSFDALSNAFEAGSIAASKIVWGAQGAAVGRTKQFAKATSGDVIEAQEGEFHSINLDKYYDFRLVMDYLERLREQLGASFLMTRGVTRHAERVTAEEIRLISQELDEALGGIYTQLAEKLQKPYARLKIVSMRRKGILTGPFDDSVKLTVIGGLEAIGRSLEQERFTNFLATIGQFPQIAERLRAVVLAQKIGEVFDVDAQDLIYTDEEVAQQQQQAQAQQLAEKVGPNVVNKAGDMINQQMTGE